MNRWDGTLQEKMLLFQQKTNRRNSDVILNEVQSI